MKKIKQRRTCLVTNLKAYNTAILNQWIGKLALGQRLVTGSFDKSTILHHKS